MTSPDQPGPLSTARAILTLSPSEAEERRQVHLPDAVVTAFDPEMHVTFVQDATAGIFIDTFKNRPSLKVGDRVRVSGVTGHGRRERIIESVTAERIGAGPFPVPIRLAPDQYRDGVADSQWVEVEGILHRSQHTQARATMELVRGDVRFSALIADIRHGTLPAWGSRLRVRGVLGGGYNLKERLVERRIFVPNLAALEVVSPGPDTADTADTAFTAIAGVGATRPLEYQPPVRIRGRVRQVDSGTVLTVADEHSEVVVRSTEVIRIAEGDVIEAVGFPARVGSTRSLEDSYVRLVAGDRVIDPPTPRFTNVAEIKRWKAAARQLPYPYGSAPRFCIPIRVRVRQRRCTCSTGSRRSLSTPRTMPRVSVPVTSLCWRGTPGRRHARSSSMPAGWRSLDTDRFPPPSRCRPTRS